MNLPEFVTFINDLIYQKQQKHSPNEKNIILTSYIL